LIQQFKQMCPGVDPAEYIEFFCLRNWGVMSNKFLADQIYVHDKVSVVASTYFL
jgi:hypothetical protein